MINYDKLGFLGKASFEQQWFLVVELGRAGSELGFFGFFSTRRTCTESNKAINN